ncbi:N-acetyltransferase [Polaromonas sp. SM01]|uniref:N-acetyltransferase n=1 Tax=Polaromonas sp. SM01 TaxID=3085630 RepID=UPI0029823C7F|nr:N-acetyltransferase [Polaromonas sp. SM01]MDW5442080.1 N-acetyltransferase [Polaromonas sp. SM01]
MSLPPYCPPCFPSLPPWLSRASWPSFPSWHLRPAELRIDVGPQTSRPLGDELQDIYTQLNKPEGRLGGLPEEGMQDPEFVIRSREADGEHYVYVEDIRQQRLAGYTVFNRLIEVGRQADRYIRAPHSKYDVAYQRRGLATAVYQRGLASGLCLVSGARQSAGAHALWRALARNYDWGFVDLRNKRLRYLGREISPQVQEDLHTRIFLLGEGWTLARFSEAAGMS